jgi:hypothetical protein
LTHSDRAVSAPMKKIGGLWNFMRWVAGRADFGDGLFLFYFVVLAREWFWPLENHLAWWLTIPLALVCWYFYVANKDEAGARPATSFWLIVALPLVFVYALRAPFPDTSFDIWSLRLFHGERGLHGFIYRAGEFFPTSAPYNPTPDMVGALFRRMLGYRLGTIVNLFALIWSGVVLDRLFRDRIRRGWLRAICVLLALGTEHVLFEINNYMPDLLALPLMLEATRLVLEREKWKTTLDRSRRLCVRFAFLMGTSVALKPSNAVVCAPLLALCVWRASAGGRSWRKLAIDGLGSMAVFAAPLAPYTIWVWRLTGNPTFPIYNAVFHSPLYPPTNGWDGRWGGFGAREILTWPVLIFFEPQRTAELAVYSGRLSFAFIVALICVLVARRLDPRMRAISFIIVASSFFWSLTMGYIRYALYLEVLSGVLLLSLAAHLFALRGSRLIAPGVISGVIVSQFLMAMRYVAHQEWSQRPTVFDAPRAWLDESKYLLRDRSIRRLLSPSQRDKFDRVRLWIVSGSKTAGLIPFLNGHAPVLGVRSAGIMAMEESQRQFARALKGYEGRAMYSIAVPEDYDDAVAALHKVGLKPGDYSEIILFPFFAPSHLVAVRLFDIKREDDRGG